MNKTLRKIRHDAKALSPVVASIILIAVTVAVSIAVAAWMGGMTIGFMGTSQATVTSVTYVTGGASIDLGLKNTGTKAITVGTVKVNNIGVTFVAKDTVNDTLTMNAGDILSITLTQAWVNGNTYKIDLFDPSNNAIGSSQTNAPGA